MSKTKILLILENNPQVCALPLILIWISGIIDIQCSFVWVVCVGFCQNSSLEKRLHFEINSQQSLLFAFYSPPSYGQCIFHAIYLTSLMAIEYDL